MFGLNSSPLGVLTPYLAIPAGNCHLLGIVVSWLYPIAVTLTLSLLLLRIRALFLRKLVVNFFRLMWLAVLAGSLTITQGVTGENIGPTQYCWISKVEPYVSSAAILPFVLLLSQSLSRLCASQTCRKCSSSHRLWTSAAANYVFHSSGYPGLLSVSHSVSTSPAHRHSIYYI